MQLYPQYKLKDKSSSEKKNEDERMDSLFRKCDIATVNMD